MFKLIYMYRRLLCVNAMCVEDVLHPDPCMSSSEVPKNIEATRVSTKTQQDHEQIVNFT
jgi:hypothetical protein